jgi:hypothetical protein
MKPSRAAGAILCQNEARPRKENALQCHETMVLGLLQRVTLAGLGA